MSGRQGGCGPESAPNKAQQANKISGADTAEADMAGMEAMAEMKAIRFFNAA